MKKYLGIDWGEKRIGLALGDDETKIASPFMIVSDIKEIMKVVEKEQVDIIVLGIPYQISNIQYPISKKFENFKKLLQDRLKIQIKLVDERLTSKAADSLPGGKKTKAARDAVAAMIILQSYFDAI